MAPYTPSPHGPSAIPSSSSSFTHLPTPDDPSALPRHHSHSKLHDAHPHPPSHGIHPVKEGRDPNLDVNLPYRTLSSDAHLDEYTAETARGSIAIAARVPSRPDTNYRLVTFVDNDPENPKNWSKGFKWWITMVVAFTCFVVALCSSVITADIASVAREFDVSEEVALLSVSVFVIGFGVGPMVFAPLSELYGRRVI
jgi:hypothetical protein